MNKWPKHSLLVYMSTVFLLFALIGCTQENDENGNSVSGPDKITGLPPDPGAGNLAGKIIGTISKKALVGVTVSVGSRTTITETDGIFLLAGIGEGEFSVMVSGVGVYARKKTINTANGRSVGIDAIEIDSGFNLNFYREIARGNHPQERDMYPTHRWTNPTPPTFYININANATLDGLVDQNTIDTVRDVLKKIVPIFTGGFYSSISIETANFPSNMSVRNVPENSFVISFDDSLANLGAYGITYTDPDFLSPRTGTINKTLIFMLENESFYKAGDSNRISFEEIIAHESGHGLGFRHTSEPRIGGLPSVMVKTGEYGGMYSSNDQLHMGIVYQRPAGNTDIDNDPISSAKMSAKLFGPQVFIDTRGNFSLTPEQREALTQLESFDLVRELADHNY